MADILIRGGRVIDPYNGTNEVRDIAVRDGVIVPAGEETAEQVIDASGCIVTPGLIDGHAHVAAEVTGLGIAPESCYYPMGVTGVIDAGSTGIDNYRAFRARTASLPIHVKALLNVCPGGLVARSYHENIDPATYRPEELIRMMRRYQDQLLGLKVRQSAEIAGDLGLKPMRAMLEIAGELGCPVTVHTTNPAGSPEEILKMLRPGDVYAHVYHGKGRTILDERENVIPALYEAQKRGVILDAANGGNHFSFRVAKAAIRQGVLPDVISTDLTVTTLFKGRKVFSLPFVMSKYLALGLSLPQIIKAAAQVPAKIMGAERELGSLSVGTAADISIFRCLARKTVFEDFCGEVMEGDRLLKTELTILGGEVVFRQADF